MPLEQMQVDGSDLEVSVTEQYLDRAQVLKEAASAYKVDTDAISTKVRQEFAAKERAKKAQQPTAKVAKKAA